MTTQDPRVEINLRLTPVITRLGALKWSSKIAKVNVKVSFWDRLIWGSVLGGGFGLVAMLLGGPIGGLIMFTFYQLIGQVLISGGLSIARRKIQKSVEDNDKVNRGTAFGGLPARLTVSKIRFDPFYYDLFQVVPKYENVQVGFHGFYADGISHKGKDFLPVNQYKESKGQLVENLTIVNASKYPDGRVAGLFYRVVDWENVLEPDRVYRPFENHPDIFYLGVKDAFLRGQRKKLLRQLRLQVHYISTKNNQIDELLFHSGLLLSPNWCGWLQYMYLLVLVEDYQLIRFRHQLKFYYRAKADKYVENNLLQVYKFKKMEGLRLKPNDLPVEEVSIEEEAGSGYGILYYTLQGVFPQVELILSNEKKSNLPIQKIVHVPDYDHKKRPEFFVQSGSSLNYCKLAESGDLEVLSSYEIKEEFIEARLASAIYLERDSIRLALAMMLYCEYNSKIFSILKLFYLDEQDLVLAKEKVSNLTGKAQKIFTVHIDHDLEMRLVRTDNIHCFSYYYSLSGGFEVLDSIPTHNTITSSNVIIFSNDSSRLDHLLCLTNYGVYRIFQYKENLKPVHIATGKIEDIDIENVYPILVDNQVGLGTNTLFLSYEKSTGRVRIFRFSEDFTQMVFNDSETHIEGNLQSMTGFKSNDGDESMILAAISYDET